MPEYTILTGLSMIIVVMLELVWFRTGIFRAAQYWIALVIIFGFQVLVDGWLTRLPDPIVVYDPKEMLGVRFPWDIPIEDFGFAFSMVTLAILLWRRALHRTAAPTEPVVIDSRADQ